MPRRDGLQALEIELAAEKASALARIARKLERHIAETERLGEALAGLAGAAREAALADYRAARAQAELHYWYLMVQRESVGIRDHTMLERLYVVPPPR